MQDEFDNRMGPDDDLMGGSTMSEMGTPADIADVAGGQPAMRPSGGVRKSSGTRRAARRTSARKAAKKKSSKKKGATKKGTKKKGARKAARKRSKTRARGGRRKAGRRH